MARSLQNIDSKKLRRDFSYARELERTSVVLGANGSALTKEEYEEADSKLADLRAHVLDNPFYTSVMSPMIVQPSLRSRGVDLSASEIRGVLSTDPMKGSAPSLKLMLDTPDLRFHRAGTSIRISEKTKPSGKKIEQAVKIDIGSGNKDRLEFEDVIKKPESNNPAFNWDLLKDPERKLVNDILETKDLDDLNLRVWMFLFGSNWQTEFMPDGNTDMLIKQKHDRYHIRDIFGWEAYVTKAEIEADQDHLTQMLSTRSVKPKDHLKDVQKTLDDIQQSQLDAFPDAFTEETRSIFQIRFDEIAREILPQIADANNMKRLSKAMGRKKFKTVDPEILGL